MGILGLGAATAFSALAADRDGAAVREPVQVTAIELQAQRDDLGLIANVLWISAGVVSAVGLVWTVIDVLDAQPRTASARLSLGPAGVVLMARSDRRPVPRAAPS